MTCRKRQEQICVRKRERKNMPCFFYARADRREKADRLIRLYR